MLYKIGGKLYEPIKVGEAGDTYQDFDIEQVCFICDAETGTYHKVACEHEVCPVCGEALLQCGCPPIVIIDDDGGEK